MVPSIKVAPQKLVYDTIDKEAATLPQNRAKAIAPSKRSFTIGNCNHAHSIEFVCACGYYSRAVTNSFAELQVWLLWLLFKVLRINTVMKSRGCDFYIGFLWLSG